MGMSLLPREIGQVRPAERPSSVRAITFAAEASWMYFGNRRYHGGEGADEGADEGGARGGVRAGAREAAAGATG